MKEYIVQAGDTLPDVAKKTLGNSGRWDEISRLNGLVGPVQLYIGQRLKLPDSAYTCEPGQNYTYNPPSSSYVCSAAPGESPALLVLARGFTFIIFEQLPEVGAGAIIRKVAVIPNNFSLSPSNVKGILSPAEHALNMNPAASQFLSGSTKSFGAPTMNGTPVLIDLAKVQAAGGKVVTVAELVADLERYVAQNPAAKTRVEKLLWAVQKIEGEMLIAGKTPAGSAKGLSSIHTEFIKSAEDLYQAFTKNQITKAQLEEGLVSLERAYSKARVVGKVGRVLMIVGVVFTAVDLGMATKRSVDQKSFKPIGAEAIRQVGGWGMAIAGAKVGGVLGAAVGVETGPGLIVTGAIGALVFGAAGYFGADWVADHISPN